ncbi:hypothetical protein Peur_011854 [Populus x canadensis]
MYSQDKKIYNTGIYVKGSTSNEFEVDYYKKLLDIQKPMKIMISTNINSMKKIMIDMKMMKIKEEEDEEEEDNCD